MYLQNGNRYCLEIRKKTKNLHEKAIFEEELSRISIW